MEPVTVLYEDDHIVVVDKPARVLVVPAPGRKGPVLVDEVSRQVGCRLAAVHRLDEDTTGAIVMSRTDVARAAMEDLFRRHEVERDYLALLSAAPSPVAARIESRLAEGIDGIVRVVPRGGERAVTHYATIARRDRCTLVRCRLETGRRNQIRAHMAALGCPIAGDRKYGFRARLGESFSRPMLHSWRMAFAHPCGGSPIRIECPPHEAALIPD
jgi:23S rRNA pseudouridine1911/1915/1917 synthase